MLPTAHQAKTVEGLISTPLAKTSDGPEDRPNIVCFRLAYRAQKI